ncbi:nitroreductase family protein [Nocardia bovistercoris]|uniref:Uncharacterized protein n=1 Tax=Nocardia bovistercoris TaxID=2785916 RepID=A0A931I8L7_9NOCA|nr:hypothetical protein [Nocardia bovistercoris]MBH0776116.1 hypothetical protein [Nocardia bovistercoris]
MTVEAIAVVPGDFHGGGIPRSRVERCHSGGERPEVECAQRVDGPVWDAGFERVDPADPADVVSTAVRRARTGGEVRARRSRAESDSITAELAPERAAAMDVSRRGGAVALAAAVRDAGAATAAHGLPAAVRIRESDGAISLFAAPRLVAGATAAGSAPVDRVGLGIVRRAEVIARLRSRDSGVGLDSFKRDLMVFSVARIAVAFGSELARACCARVVAPVRRVRIGARRPGPAVRSSPSIHLRAQSSGELAEISPGHADTLASLQSRFPDLLEVPRHETMALVLRLSYAAAATVRSRRRPVPGVDTRS